MRAGCSTIFLCAIQVLFFLTVETRQLNEVNENRPTEGCYVDFQLHLVGESWTPRGLCAKSTCTKEGSYYTVPCALAALPPGSPCFFTQEDLTEPYPKCCPQIVCPGIAS